MTSTGWKACPTTTTWLFLPPRPAPLRAAKSEGEGGSTGLRPPPFAVAVSRLSFLPLSRPTSRSEVQGEGDRGGGAAVAVCRSNDRGAARRPLRGRRGHNDDDNGHDNDSKRRRSSAAQRKSPGDGLARAAL
jgi:hypothetical protein